MSQWQYLLDEYDRVRKEQEKIWGAVTLMLSRLERLERLVGTQIRVLDAAGLLPVAHLHADIADERSSADALIAEELKRLQGSSDVSP